MFNLSSYFIIFICLNIAVTSCFLVDNFNVNQRILNHLFELKKG
jgi:hypothetical protein